jgi:GAF domain-containing protein
MTAALDPDADLLRQADGLFAGERDPWANAANAAALLFERLPDLNWAGFYFLRGGELVVGPFQGRVACVRIGLGAGVCGTAAARHPDRARRARLPGSHHL